MDNCHNYATTSKKRRIPISDDIHIIIKKFRDKDKHDEKPSTSGDHDYDDEHSMDSEELKRVRQQEPSSSCITVGPSSSNNSNSGGPTIGSAIGASSGGNTTSILGGSGIAVGTTGSISLQQPQAAPSAGVIQLQSNMQPSSHSDDIKLILKKLSNIEELLKVVAEQSFNRLAALKQEASGAGTVLPANAASLGLLTAADPTVAAATSCVSIEQQQQQPSQQPQPMFKFPFRTLKELVELNKGICSDESLYNKLFEYLTKIKLECDEDIVMNALNMVVTDEVLDAVTWDGGKKFKLSSLVIFSDSLYVAWFKDRLKYDEYVSEMKDAIEKSHRRYAKSKAKKSISQQHQHQTLTLTAATTTSAGSTVSGTTTAIMSDGQLFLS